MIKLFHRHVSPRPTAVAASILTASVFHGPSPTKVEVPFGSVFHVEGCIFTGVGFSVVTQNENGTWNEPIRYMG